MATAVKFTELPAAVQVMTELHREGNIVPHSWYLHLQRESLPPGPGTDKTPRRRSYPQAILILAEVCYWYTARHECSESTLQEDGWTKRFAADKWCCTYEQLADKLGFTKDEVRAALRYLESQGLVTLEFRQLNLSNGGKLYNVLYIAPVPEAIAAITYRRESPQTATVVIARVDLPDCNGIPPLLQSDTCTEISPEITKTEEGAKPENHPAYPVVEKAPPRESSLPQQPQDQPTAPDPACPRRADPSAAWDNLAASPRPDASSPPADALAPDTPGTRALFSGRRLNGAAKHRRVAERFTSVQQRDMFLRAEQVLGGLLDAILEKAFVKCGNNLAGLVLYLNGAAEKQQNAPPFPPAGNQPAGNGPPVSGLTPAQREKVAQRNAPPVCQ